MGNSPYSGNGKKSRGKFWSLEKELLSLIQFAFFWWWKFESSFCSFLMLKKKLIDKKNSEEAFTFLLSKSGKYNCKHNYKENVFQ